jgi:hypothetical protein
MDVERKRVLTHTSWKTDRKMNMGFFPAHVHFSGVFPSFLKGKQRSVSGYIGIIASAYYFKFAMSLRILSKCEPFQ